MRRSCTRRRDGSVWNGVKGRHVCLYKLGEPTDKPERPKVRVASYVEVWATRSSGATKTAQKVRSEIPHHVLSYMSQSGDDCTYVLSTSIGSRTLGLIPFVVRCK